MNDLQCRLERLLNRLLEGGVIPFVGAGISIEARVPKSPFEPSVSYLEGQLRRKLEADPDRYDSDAPERQTIRSLLSPPTGREPSLAWLAELSAHVWGQKTVCEVLQIAQFADLEPRPAHRYLVYLAREGLLTEIISTNYDCCIEKAFQASFGHEKPTKGTLAVIHNLADYRATGGRLTISGRPVLHLYKINGCAQAYRDARPQIIERATPEQHRVWRNAAERIILTEQQLQNFRNEHWAEDLFRDRARTRNLLFCGFGSEEPQVRHTALSLVAEFQNNALQGDPLSPEETAALPNAPFMATYDQSPSFTHLQILVAFVNAHSNGLRGMPRGRMPYRLEPFLLNLFSGRDATALGAPEPKLAADLFLRCLYQGALHRLVEREIDEGTIFFTWLRRLTERPRAWLDSLHTVLSPANSDQARDSTRGTASLLTHDFGAWHDLLERPAERRPLTLWHWLWAMQYPMEAENPPDDWYLPLRDNSLFVLSTLLVLRSLTASPTNPRGDNDRCSIPHAQPVNDCGLQVKIPTVAGGRTAVYLVHEYAAVRFRMTRAADTPRSRLMRRIALPSARYFDTEERWIVEDSSLEPDSHQTVVNLRVGRQEVIAADDLIRHAGTPDRFLDSLHWVQAAIRPNRRVALQPL